MAFQDIGSISTTYVEKNMLYVEWKIEDFVSYVLNEHECWNSPTFCSFTATWCLQLSFARNIQNNSKRNLIMHLFRCAPKTYNFNKCITYILGLKRDNGSVYRSVKDECIYSLDNYAFPATVLEVSELIRDRRFVVSKGSVTFFCTAAVKCTVDVPKRTWSDKGQQTSLDEGHQTTSDKGQQTSLDEGHQTTSDKGQQTSSDNGLRILSGDLKNLLLSGDNSDVTIKVRGTDFNAHTQLLASRSPVFASMFSHDMKEKRSRTVDVDDCDPETFKEFLVYVYSGQTENISSENVINMYCISDKYDIPDLKVMCSEYMKENVSVDSFCDVMLLAIRYEDSVLVECATTFFLENIEKIIVTVKWLSFAKDYHVQANELFIKKFRKI